MVLGIVTPIWKRMELSRLFYKHYEALSLPYTLVRVAVCSREDDAKLAQDHGWTVVNASNSPATNKHNAGMHILRDMDVDAAMLIPSDDFFSEGYFHAVSDAIDDGRDALVLKNLFFVCSETGRCIEGFGLHMGAGLALSRAVLERVDWQPWDEDATGSADAHLFAKTGRHIKRPITVHNCKAFGFAGVDVKGPESLHSFDQLSAGLTRQQKADFHDVAPHYWPSLLEYIPEAQAC